MKPKEFEQLSKRVLEKELGEEFDEQPMLSIGSPSKIHYFDLANRDLSVIVECKSYGWCRGKRDGSVPSAKIDGLYAELLRLNALPWGIRRIITLRKDTRIINDPQSETFAHYFFRLHKSFLYGVEIWEIDIDTGQVEKYNQSNNCQKINKEFDLITH